MNKAKLKAFTLVELLVVISIIALLLSILMPSLGRARNMAKELLCTSNFHQISIALTSYSTDNKGFLPPVDPFSDPYSDKLYTGSLDVIYENGVKKGLGMLMPAYANAIKIYICPMDKYIVDELKDIAGEKNFSGLERANCSYIYEGGFTNKTMPYLIPKEGDKRLKLYDKPIYSPLAFDRCLYDSRARKLKLLHENTRRINIINMSGEIKYVVIPKDTKIYSYGGLAQFLDEQLRK